jgi:hypothetical protein
VTLTFDIGDNAEEYRDAYKRWTPCEIIGVNKLIPGRYKVKGIDGYVTERHASDLRKVLAEEEA